jgi:hypothetical protein
MVPVGRLFTRVVMVVPAELVITIVTDAVPVTVIKAHMSKTHVWAGMVIEFANLRDQRLAELLLVKNHDPVPVGGVRAVLTVGVEPVAPLAVS